MPASSIRVVSEVNGPSVCADRGFLAKPETCDQIYAYASEMEWLEKPFYYIVSRWLDRRHAAQVCMGKRSGPGRARRRPGTEVKV